MPKPAKTVKTMTDGKRCHRSKETLEYREECEKKLQTNENLKENDEVKRNPAAHKKFVEMKRLYTKIDMNNVINSMVLNRYCLLYSECREYEVKQEKLKERLQEYRLKFENDEITEEELIFKEDKIDVLLSRNDDKLMKKRDMMFKIEKESGGTPQSILRLVPKKPPKDEEDNDPIENILNKRGYRVVR